MSEVDKHWDLTELQDRNLKKTFNKNGSRHEFWWWGYATLVSCINWLAEDDGLPEQ